MSLDRRDFLKWTGVTALGAATSMATGCAENAPASAPAGKAEMMKVGLYSWAEMLYLPNQIRWLGLSYARIGGVMSDAVMTFCAENHIEVLLNVTPAAARTSFDTDAEFIAAYLAQIDFALKTYGPDGTFWKANSTLHYSPVSQIEVCNEPNFGYGFSGSAPETAILYAHVLIATYNRIKATWPSVTVVGFAAGGVSNAAPAFVAAVLHELQAAGQVDCFDVMSVHPYSSNHPPDQVITEDWGTWVPRESLHAVQQLMVDVGIGKPVWISEVGYQIAQAEGGKFPTAVLDAAGHPGTVTPMQQAAYTVRINMAAARYDVDRVYHMCALDTDDYNGGWFGNSPQNDPRPVAIAMRQVISLLSGTTHLEAVLDGSATTPEGPFAYRFTTPRGRVMVAWCQVPGKFKLPIDPDAETTVTDMLANTIATLTDSSFMASLSEMPIFLSSSSTEN